MKLPRTTGKTDRRQTVPRTIHLQQEQKPVDFLSISVVIDIKITANFALSLTMEQHNDSHHQSNRERLDQKGQIDFFAAP
jgi:hypothetical protein